MGFDGDYDECDDPKRQWAKSLVHHTIVDALTRFLKDCGMVEVKKEYKYWDPARVGKDGSRRVPDVTCVNPNTGTEYVLDARIYWNSMSNGRLSTKETTLHKALLVKWIFCVIEAIILKFVMEIKT